MRYSSVKSGIPPSRKRQNATFSFSASNKNRYIKAACFATKGCGHSSITMRTFHDIRVGFTSIEIGIGFFPRRLGKNLLPLQRMFVSLHQKQNKKHTNKKKRIDYEKVYIINHNAPDRMFNNNGHELRASKRKSPLPYR